jgi:hypothetical protein
VISEKTNGQATEIDDLFHIGEYNRRRQPVSWYTGPIRTTALIGKSRQPNRPLHTWGPIFHEGGAARSWALIEQPDGTRQIAAIRLDRASHNPRVVTVVPNVPRKRPVPVYVNEG